MIIIDSLQSMRQKTYMARALDLARRGRFTTSPNPNVGCVIVREGKIVGEGWHMRAGSSHAEVSALEMAGDQARGATAFVTLEPCSHHGLTPPCCEALIVAGISHVVVAIEDPDPRVRGRGFRRLEDAGIQVSKGLMAQEAEMLNRAFLKRMRTGTPFVQLKLATSVDGRTAMASGESQWITSCDARRNVQRFRAQSCAILSTSGTVLADDPALTVRWESLDVDVQSVYPQENIRQPIRVIIDSQNRITPQHRLVHQPGKTWLIRLQKDNQIWPNSVDQILVQKASLERSQGLSKTGQIDLHSLMLLLGEKQVNRLWVEAGATLAGALLKAGLVDELIIYLAPKLLGNDARTLCCLPGLNYLRDAPTFEFIDIHPLGPDVRLTLRPV